MMKNQPKKTEEVKTSDRLASYAGYSVGEKVTYLVEGRRFRLIATITNILRHPLTEKSIVFELLFEDESLPSHLRTQALTFPENQSWIEKIVDF